MKEGWMKNDVGGMKDEDRWMNNDEGWRMNDEGWWFQAVEGFCFRTNRQTDRQTDICEWRVTFVTEKIMTKNVQVHGFIE